MTLWRALISWLARDQIADAWRECVRSTADHAAYVQRAARTVEEVGASNAKLVAMIEVVKCQAFAEGQAQGFRAAVDEMERLIDERTEGMGGPAEREDIEALRKRWLH